MTPKDWPDLRSQLLNIQQQLRLDMAEAKPEAKRWLMWTTANIAAALQDLHWATLMQAAASPPAGGEEHNPTPSPTQHTDPPSSESKERADNFPPDTTHNPYIPHHDNTPTELSDGTDRAQSKEGTDRAPNQP